jgi:hypothetical protein
MNSKFLSPLRWKVIFLEKLRSERETQVNVVIEPLNGNQLGEEEEVW